MKLMPLDVICQHSVEGTVIPLRIRVKDEEGMYQSFTVKGYREVPHEGAVTMPDGVYVSDSSLVFECRIYPFGQEKRITLYYNPSEIVWRMKA